MPNPAGNLTVDLSLTRGTTWSRTVKDYFSLGTELMAGKKPARNDPKELISLASIGCTVR